MLGSDHLAPYNTCPPLSAFFGRNLVINYENTYLHEHCEHQVQHAGSGADGGAYVDLIHYSTPLSE